MNDKITIKITLKEIIDEFCLNNGLNSDEVDVSYIQDDDIFLISIEGVPYLYKNSDFSESLKRAYDRVQKLKDLGL